MQKFKLTMIAILMSPIFFSGAANAANIEDASVVAPKISLDPSSISSGEIDIDEIDEVLNGSSGGGGGGGL